MQLKLIEDLCHDCRAIKATFALIDDNDREVGRYCTKDAPGALRRGGGPKPERKKPEAAK